MPDLRLSVEICILRPPRISPISINPSVISLGALYLNLCRNFLLHSKFSCLWNHTFCGVRQTSSFGTRFRGALFSITCPHQHHLCESSAPFIGRQVIMISTRVREPSQANALQLSEEMTLGKAGGKKCWLSFAGILNHMEVRGI